MVPLQQNFPTLESLGARGAQQHASPGTKEDTFIAEYVSRATFIETASATCDWPRTLSLSRYRQMRDCCVTSAAAHALTLRFPKVEFDVLPLVSYNNRQA